METVNIDEARTRLSELVSGTAAGQRYIIQEKDRPVAALISVAELDRLQRITQAIYQRLLALGQDPELVRQIEAGEVHPAMAVFGLWQDGDQADHLTEEIYADRLQQNQRGEVEL